MSESIFSKIKTWNTALEKFNMKKLPVTAGLHKSETFQSNLYFNADNFMEYEKMSDAKILKFEAQLGSGTLLTQEMTHLFFLAQIWLVA